jgi:hypothetical protein
LKTDLYPVSTKIALCRGVSIGINVQGIIRTGLHAGFAADTSLVIKIDNTVPAAKERHRRTYLDTWRFVAVIAPENGKVTARLGKDPLFNVLHPRAMYTDGDIVLFLAGNRAGMTTNATILIDDKAVPHEILRSAYI